VEFILEPDSFCYLSCRFLLAPGLGVTKLLSESSSWGLLAFCSLILRCFSFFFCRYYLRFSAAVLS
jgi:hypothetical protein